MSQDDDITKEPAPPPSVQAATLEATINAAFVAMFDARERYENAVEAMKLLEAERRLLVGGPWNQGRLMGTAKRLLPMLLKGGGLVAGGGGITAIMADTGAFASVVAKLTALFGG